MTQRADESAADAMCRRSADWAAGAAEGRAYNHRVWLAMTPAERVSEGLELIRIAELLQAGAERRRSTAA